ncbi:unnamed protein product [Brachionus calyciflorus]|uniref:Uncharacterized protein n=1 Tax=Brachionus calyciflorus TaxID=104777 RepID=A0A814BK84_9BILA|nr:unnamed protein product [Brachionus calyciflorus]
MDNWKFSKCTCDHVIECSYRLKLMNFNKIGINIPKSNKRKRGTQSKTIFALERNPFDVQNVEDQIESDKETFQSKRTNIEAQQMVSNETFPTTSKNLDKLCENMWFKNALEIRILLPK